MEAPLPETLVREPVRNLPSALQPAISYSMAMRSHFTLDQITYSVRSCPNEVFRQFIARCELGSFKGKHWTPIRQANLLQTLEADYSDVARWYALELLLEHKVVVPLEI